MLIQLEIKNFAIIEHSIIDFNHGFNVISGETGAGKSIILDALGAIIGERTSKNSVRKGEEKAELKAVFLKTPKLIHKLLEKNIEIEDDYIIIKRQISSNGRSIVKLNGSIQTTQVIKEVCEELVEICGQKDHLELLKEDKYLQMIDQLGDESHLPLLSEVKNLYSEWVETRKTLESLLSNEREKEQILDLYRFQLNEIDSMNLVIGEDETLQDEKKFLSSFEKIAKSVDVAINHLHAIDSIEEAKNALLMASKFDDKIREYVERLENVCIELKDIQSDVGYYIDSVEYDEARLNEIMFRLEQIHTLKRKYADSIEGILDFRNEIEQKLNDMDNKEEKVSQLQNRMKKIENKLLSLSNVLHQRRVDICQKHEKLINQKIKELCMPHAVFRFYCLLKEQFSLTGMTHVSILFNANKGEDLKPLSKVASGGELSRVLLALKMVQNSKDVSTLIFDEIDEGIGGEVGRVIGERLRVLGSDVQVIVISHLPQVAAKANHHFLIQKQIEEERTISSVRKLSSEERIEEIARMIYGDEKNETTLKQAREMISSHT